jgi:glycopeptide antibiotics resistance protein
VRRLRIGKGAQGLLLTIYTILLLGVTMLVQGGPGVRTNLAPFEDVKRLMARASRGDVFSNGFLYALVGIAGNLLMFAIWGFLAWKFLDVRGRKAWRNHVDVILSGVLFSVGIETVQLFLPTRSADVNDVFWNVLGTVVGSILAHLDRTFTLEWE